MNTVEKPYTRQRSIQNGVETEQLVFSSVQQALDYLLPRIRTKSRQFYEREITKELTDKGSTIVDHHAGQGIFYIAEMTA